ncbi:MAG: tRNA (adenosine(37)-N6)-threonylcarbamoyltransferase complex transferase subunit TsaD [Candidatus Gottesmanbacteria bacterium]|nr:tRNA (adenosine(37)-N6)-threonylcarbamoyltransferase complex transferase subunit TsaD [Candidatus Gottesmanbacteria bacterium]
MNILAIETSFDETACAIIEDGTKIISNVLATSHEMHDKYGGVVPEIAARRQLECIIPVISESLQPLATSNSTLLHRSGELFPDWIRKTIKESIDAIAVTVGPGLIGSLLVGVETAKTIAFVTDKPIIPVNHVLAHMYANFLDSNRENSSRAQSRKTLIEFPSISLVVSGGHTELYLMKSAKDLTWIGGTLDDAAGECFDKTARLLGFGHGGGVAIEAAASKYQIANSKNQIKLPRPMMDDKTLNFSFSGLKTAVMREWKKCHPGLDPGSSSKKDSGSEAGMTSAFAHEIQEAITDVLVKKTIRAAKQYEAKSILLSGGVAANTRLREKFLSTLSTLHSPLFFAPPPSLCTDNAVMIAACAYFNGESTNWRNITAAPDLSVELFNSSLTDQLPDSS